MSLLRKLLSLGATALVFVVVAPAIAPAQFFNRPNPPGSVMDEDGDGAPEDRRSESQSALLQRVERLEKDLKSLTGQIEQLQFQVRKLEESARQNAGAMSSTSAPILPKAGLEPSKPTSASSAGPISSPPVANENGKLRRGDAFDPTQNPGAPGAPRPIGDAQPSAPLAAPLEINRAAAQGASQPIGRPPAEVAGLDSGLAPAASPRDEYTAASALLKQGDYDGAEKGFSAFLSKYPKSRLAADAHYQLGESYFQRNRPTEAAQQFLKITTDFPTAARAPEAFLRLGQSLNALGAKEQACASFSKIERNYPNASANLRAAVDRETKKAGC